MLICAIVSLLTVLRRKWVWLTSRASSAYPNETDMKARRKRRTNAHIVKLQIKQGKRPPLTTEEDLSESELPDESIPKAPVTNLRVAVGTALNSVEAMLNENISRKRKLGDRSTKRYGPAEVALADNLKKILSRFMENPVYAQFVDPIDPVEFPTYHSRIPNPISMKDIMAVGIL
jgi:hypothetical protein